MDKYSFILFHSDVDNFLGSVQNLGIVDITRQNKAIDEKSRELFTRSKRYQGVIKKLMHYFESSTEEDKTNFKEFSKPDTLDQNEFLKFSEELIINKEQWESELEQLKREFQDSSVWGILSKDDLSKISLLGYNIHLFCTPEKSFNEEWGKEHVLYKLNNLNDKIYFAILSPKGEDFKFGIQEVKLPQKSCDIIKSRMFELESNLSEIKETLISLHKEIPRLESGLKAVSEELELYLAGVSSQKEAEGNIVILTGFAPVENRATINLEFQNENVFYLVEEAVKEDDPPVKLKNGFFSRLFEPIGELYMLPKYGELDLTPYFAPFYMLFFGLCLGDIGYGLVLLTGATIAKLKFPKFKGYLTLIQFLGFGAVMMAMLSGVFFGAPLKDLITLPESVQNLFFSDIKMFWFSIIFGLFQIIFAKILNAIYLMKKNGWQYGMSNFGWSILIVWASMKYASTMTDDITVPVFLNYFAIAGALSVLLFSSDSKNIFSRIGSGVVSFWDVTSIFGDTLSYIRLFGLGTAGAILGMVVNSVAVSLSDVPYMGWLLAGLMLVAGHILVLLLSSLGAFVHPMRLTFVEFYKNANFSGGGRPFRPLSKKNRE
ncbi:MAG: V-type ATP synthase subunit I [Bacteroidales bacterium]